MSLAMYAAPFNNDFNDYKNSDNEYINKKKQIHNKTQKRNNNDNFDEKKVKNVLQKIHDNSVVEDDTLGDFNPPPMPESVGVNKTNATESMQNMSSENMLKNLGSVPSPNYDDPDDLDLNNFNANYGDDKTVEDYYKKMIPMYQKQAQQNQIQQNQINRQYYNNYRSNDANTFVESNSNDVLLQKLNYMINLLEEQQDEKTNNVTEEVVLYSFLGIFIIFVVDSFARVGKYIR